jgi:transposase
METLHECCCGLDVHKKTVVACLLKSEAGQTPSKAVRTFGTMTDELLALRAWLEQAGCTHVAMESTGVYWKPIYNVLEGHFTLLVANAQYVKRVPGRKTDVSDAEWLATLMRHGLVSGSYIPTAQERELRDLTRYRTTLTDERGRVVKRLQKVLEDANIKVASVASDVTGVSVRAMLTALIKGERDVAVLSQLARGRLREKQAELARALRGHLKAHHAFLLSELLAHLDYLDASIDRVEAQIDERTHPFEATLERLDSIPGVSRQLAAVILAEVGTDWSRFPSAPQLASWAGMCPGKEESAGKNRSGKTRPGNRWLRRALVQAAHGAEHTKGSYLQAQYRRLRQRRGAARAAVAVGHTILVTAHCLVTRADTYRELGGNYFDQRQRDQVKRQSIRRLERLGYQVSITDTQVA